VSGWLGDARKVNWKHICFKWKGGARKRIGFLIFINRLVPEILVSIDCKHVLTVNIGVLNGLTSWFLVDWCL
jgi:hypothetical protein